MAYSYGHREAYENTMPDEHIYSPPYEPNPVEEHDPSYYDDDTRPMLQEQPNNEASSSSLTLNDQAPKWATITSVPLFKGNLVLDCPVPTKLFNQLSADQQELREFTHVRYSAATCDPADFLNDRFTLRQKLYPKARNAELFIVVTMYNEEEDLLARTLMGVFQNVNYMEGLKESEKWGNESWKKIVVCIVSDGIEKINPRSRALLAGLGVFQAGITKGLINDKATAAHIFEVRCY
jgi:chitin synthase